MNRAAFAMWVYRLRQAGWPLWLGVAATVLALAMGPWLADPLRAQATQLDQRLAQLRRDEARRLDDATDKGADSGTAFTARLPGGDAALAAVEDLHRLAQLHGVVLASGDYRLLRDGAQAWQRYQISLPAQGDDLALRRWMADALNRWPTLALDDWTLTREQAEQVEVQARVRWSFYLRTP